MAISNHFIAGTGDQIARLIMASQLLGTWSRLDKITVTKHSSIGIDESYIELFWYVNDVEHKAMWQELCNIAEVQGMEVS